MAFESNIPVETIFGLTAPNAYAVIYDISSTLNEFVRINVRYYANKSSFDGKKAPFDSFEYKAIGQEYQTFAQLLAESNGNIFIAAYNFLRLIKNEQGDLVFPVETWESVD